MAKHKSTKKAKPCNHDAEEPASVPSISIEEANKMIEHATRKVKASRTLYDDRVDLLDRLKDNESRIRELEDDIHHEKLRNKGLRIELDQTNRAIIRQMELDVE